MALTDASLLGILSDSVVMSATCLNKCLDTLLFLRMIMWTRPLLVDIPCVAYDQCGHFLVHLLDEVSEFDQQEVEVSEFDQQEVVVSEFA